jgi:hypothetical protein
MRTISVWAYRNPWPARILLALLHITLICLGYALAQLLEMQASMAWMLGFASFTIAIGYFLLTRKWSSRCRHLLIASASFWLVVFFFQSGGGLDSMGFGYPVQQVKAAKTADDVPKLAKKKKVQLFKFLKRGSDEKGGKVVLTILTVLAALVLVFLVGSLSCSLACSGADALALIVGIGGLALVLLGMIAVLKRIKRGPKQKDIPGKEVNDQQ